MNIFVLDFKQELCAQYHTDRHVVKMITETAQLLTSAYYFQDKYKDEVPYKLTHANHPCSKWARLSQSNWEWLLLLGINLYKEYMFRFGNKVHKGGSVLLWCYDNKPNLPDMGLTPFPLCMPNECKTFHPVLSYRQYYNMYKYDQFKWTKRHIPEWINIRKDYMQ